MLINWEMRRAVGIERSGQTEGQWVARTQPKSSSLLHDAYASKTECDIFFTAKTTRDKDKTEKEHEKKAVKLTVPH